MSKNTQISELINYISVNESGNVVFTTVPAASSNTDKFLVSDSGVLKFRTATQLLSDIGAQASGSYQAALSGTGFVKISGSTISYDNSTYLTTSSASSTYLPLIGGTLTGGLLGTTGSFSSFITAQSTGGSGLRIYGSSGTNQWDIYLNSTNLRFSDNTGTGSVVFDRPISGTTATFSSSVTAQTNLGVINANASQAGFVADYTGAGALKVSFSTYNDIMNIFNETNSYSLLNFTRSTKHLVLNPTGENVTVNTTNTGASGLSINNQHNLSFSEGSGLSYVNIFRQRNSAALVMGAGYKRSVTGAFASSFSSAMARAAIAIGYNNGSIVFFTDASSTVANGTDITPTERFIMLASGDATFNSSLTVTTTGTFGFQDYRTQATQKVLVLNAEGVSGNYAPALFNIYTKPGTTVNGIASIIIKSKYGSEAESGNLFEFRGDGSSTFSGAISINTDGSFGNSRTGNNGGGTVLNIMGSSSSSTSAQLNLTQVWNGVQYPIILKNIYNPVGGAASSIFTLSTTQWNGSTALSTERFRVDGNDGIITIGDTLGYTTAQKGQFFSKGGGSMFTANLLSGGWGRHFTMQRNDSTKWHIGVDGSDNFGILDSGDSFIMTLTGGGVMTANTFKSNVTPGSPTLDSSGSFVTLANGAYVDFPAMSGMIMVNNTGTGAVQVFICGGGNTGSLGYVVNVTGTMTHSPGVGGYRFTNNTGSSWTFAFQVFKTRGTA